MERNLEPRLPEAEAQALCLVRAVEETDRGGRLLPHDRRRQATVEAGGGVAGTGDDDASWLGPRALRLLPELGDVVPHLGRLLRAARPASGLLAPAVAVAFVVGLATNALGPERRIQVLAVPLLGLVAWNLAVILLTVARHSLPLAPPAAAGRLLDLLHGAARRLARRLVERVRSRPDAERDLLRDALGRFLRHWLPATTPLAAARLRRLLHAAALALVAGVVAGMYLRGLAWEYRVTWESTFLTEGAVETLLDTVLAPASSLLGVEVPDVAPIRSPESGDAAPWIHLWAVTAGVFVGVPRMLLVAAEGWRCARLRRRLPVRIPDAYRRRLVAAAATSEERVAVVPYSYRPTAASSAALKGLLLDLFGPRTEIRLGAVVDYGAGPDAVPPSDARCRAVLFSLAQTPEVEVHGELLERLRAELADGQALLALVDAAPYRRRMAATGAELADRLAERRRSWDRVIRAAGLEPVHLDLEGELPDDALTLLVERAWPPGALEV